MKGWMLRALLVVALLVTPRPMAAIEYTAFEQVTVGASAIGFTSSLIVQGNGHQQAVMATCRLETAQIRYRIDGTAPTSTVGTNLEIGDTLVLQGADVLVRFSAIRTGGSSGQLNCTYTSN